MTTPMAWGRINNGVVEMIDLARQWIADPDVTWRRSKLEELVREYGDAKQEQFRVSLAYVHDQTPENSDRVLEAGLQVDRLMREVLQR